MSKSYQFSDPERKLKFQKVIGAFPKSIILSSSLDGFDLRSIFLSGEEFQMDKLDKLIEEKRK